MSRVLDINTLMDRAEECLVLARLAVDDIAAASYLSLAGSYESMAEDERRKSAFYAARAVTRKSQSA
jgi:hypothetical protein